MKVAELKELLKQKDLPISGTKAELMKDFKLESEDLGAFTILVPEVT